MLKEKVKTIKRGEIYIADLSPSVGCEQDGLRPVLVIQNNKGNEHSKTTIIAPLTSKTDKDLPTHVHISVPELKKKSIVMLEQIRVIDKSRLTKYICKIDKTAMGCIDFAIITSLGVQTMTRIISYKGDDENENFCSE